ncbi:MAG: hypothetical protein AAF334_00735 [Pseudomonadota bacterium]
MPRVKSKRRSGGTVFCCGAALLLLAACTEGEAAGGGASATSSAPAAQYSTSADHFRGMQLAGLRGDYDAFAEHLKTDDPGSVLAELGRSFGGGPFDVYTSKSEARDDSHRRIVELRSTAGRLYVYVALDRVPGGWIVADRAVSRNRQTVSSRI